MLLVVEGVDGTGKTTLCSKLHEDILLRYGGEVDRRKCSQPKRHVLEEYVYDVEGYSPGNEYHVIYDRHYIGEMVYGPLYRGGSQLDEPMRRFVELVLQARGAIVVILHPDDDWERRLYEERGETYLQRAHAREAADAFRAMYRMDAFWPINIEGLPTRWHVDALLNAALLAEKMVSDTVLWYPTLVGNSTEGCQYLLLGDTRGPKQLEVNFKSCFVPYPGTSGHYLMRAVPAELQYKFAVANACEERQLIDLWQRLGEPYVVALGINATEACENMLTGPGVRYGVVPHPQYIRRFHHKRIDEYGEMMVKTAETGTTWRP